VDIKALLVTFDGLSNSRLAFRLFPFADEKHGNALTQPTFLKERYLLLSETLLGFPIVTNTVFLRVYPLPHFKRIPFSDAFQQRLIRKF
jgi:hypothetical protein